MNDELWLFDVERSEMFGCIWFSMEVKLGDLFHSCVSVSERVVCVHLDVFQRDVFIW